MKASLIKKLNGKNILIVVSIGNRGSSKSFGNLVRNSKNGLNSIKTVVCRFILCQYCPRIYFWHKKELS